MKNSWNKATSHMHTCTSAFLSDSRAKAFSATLPLFWKIETKHAQLSPLLHLVACSSAHVPPRTTPGAPGRQAGCSGGEPSGGAGWDQSPGSQAPAWSL